MTNPDDDIQADIRAAFDAPAPEAPVEAPEPDATPIEPDASEPVEEEKTRTRGADGKFLAKEAEVKQDATDQSSKEATEPPSQAVTRPPSSWSPAAKAEFAQLPPAVQQAVAKREQEIDQGLRRKAEEVKRYEPLESVIAPRRAMWAAQGMDEASAIKTLLAAQDLLEQDARKGIEFLAKSYGVDLAQPQGQAQGSPQPAGQPQPDNALLQRIAALESSLQASQTATYQAQIEAFQSDPKNLYFENVRDDMAALISTGKAKDLSEAYEMACWMNPEIRPLLQTPQVVTEPAKVQRARAAGVSVTGSPAETGFTKNPNGSIDDDIRAALQELNGR